jgi:DNA-directed RNA polymerase subunit RPC12/RpoP
VGKTKRKKSSLADAVLIFVLWIWYSVLAILAAAFLFLSNMFSVSTLIDYGPDLWIDNMVSLHTDEAYQATYDLSVFEDASIESIDKGLILIIPKGAIFLAHGNIEKGYLTWTAIEIFDGTRRVTGFTASETPKSVQATDGTTRTLSLPGFRFVGSYASGNRPNSSRYVLFPTLPSDQGVWDSITRNYLFPARAFDLHRDLTIKFATTTTDIERIKENSEYSSAPELSSPRRLAYFPTAQKDTYEAIVADYNNDAVKVALFQAAPDFDPITAIRDDEMPNLPSYGYIHWGLGGLIVFLIFTAFHRASRVSCPHCGHKSHAHERIDLESFKNYKHETKSGNPDMRYIKNPIIRSTLTTYSCENCGAEFEILSRS